MKKISSEKKYLKQIAELNYYASLQQIDEAKNLYELQKISEVLENESRDLLMKVILAAG